MSTDFSIKPVGAPAVVPVVPPRSDAAQQAITTELPPSRSVTAVDADARASLNSDVVRASTSQQVLIDRAAAAIVYQVVDDRTSQVLKQFPDEAVLRRRAYFRALDLTRDAPTRMRATDRQA